MYIFLDESGDLGFNWQYAKTSHYFVITLLISADFSIFKSAIKRTLRNKLNHASKKRIVHELKGTGTTLEIRKYFYQQLAKYDNWYLHTLILDKHHIKEPHITNKERLYNRLAKNVLQGLELVDNTKLVHIYVDKSKSNPEIATFDRYIRLNLDANLPLNTRLNIEHLNSQSNAGLQAVDMFCYGISRKYETREDTWYRMFEGKIKREFIYRP